MHFANERGKRRREKLGDDRRDGGDAAVGLRSLFISKRSNNMVLRGHGGTRRDFVRNIKAAGRRVQKHLLYSWAFCIERGGHGHLRLYRLLELTNYILT